MVIGSGVWGGVKSLIAGVLFSHAFSGELKAMSIMDDAIEDGVGKGRIAYISCHWSTGIWLVTMVDRRP